jgi:hypothetical protein
MKTIQNPAIVSLLLAAASISIWAEEPVPQPPPFACPGPLVDKPPGDKAVVNSFSDLALPHPHANPDSLAAHYDFSDYDPATGSVPDKSGNGFDLAAVGQHATVTEGIAGKGVMLDGGYFQAKGNPLAGADLFTVSLWFKTAEPLNNYKLAAAAVWSGGNNATHYSEFWADNQEGSLRGEPGWERHAVFVKGEWNHLVVSYDGEHVREYINGKQSTEIQGTGRLVGKGVPMLLGAWMGFQFNGALDEVRIYRRALSAKEIQVLHKAPGKRQRRR